MLKTSTYTYPTTPQETLQENEVISFNFGSEESVTIEKLCEPFPGNRIFKIIFLKRIGYYYGRVFVQKLKCKVG